MATKNLSPSQITNNKEAIQLIWLDGNINDSSDCILTKSMLIELNPAVQFYTDFDRCLDLIKSIKHEKIFVIVSPSFVGQILSQVSNYKSIIAIFIFRGNLQQYKSLVDEHNEIIGVYTNQKTLFEAIRMKMNLIEKQTLAFDLFNQKQKSIKDLSKESALFIWNQMLIHVLKQIPQDQRSKQQMIDLCRDYYQNNNNVLMSIEIFNNNYTSNQAIEWFTEESFFFIDY
jgi:UDP-N-acetylglucosamine transferase subunit ALG13